MLRFIFVLAFLWAGFTSVPAVAAIHGGGTPYPATCPQGLSTPGDGCLNANINSYALDEIGGNVGPNGWPTDAQQSCTTYACWNLSLQECYIQGCGQTWTGGTHPFLQNMPGIDYPVGTYTALSGLTDPATAAVSATLADPGLGILPKTFSYGATGRAVTMHNNQGNFPIVFSGGGTTQTPAGARVRGFYFGPDQPGFHTVGAQTTGNSVITAGSPDTISMTLAVTSPVGFIDAHQNVYEGCTIHSTGAPTGCTQIGTLDGQVSGTTGGTGVYNITGDTPGTYTGVTVSHDAVWVEHGPYYATANSTMTWEDNWFEMGNSTNQTTGNFIEDEATANNCPSTTWNFVYNTVLGDAINPPSYLLGFNSTTICYTQTSSCSQPGQNGFWYDISNLCGAPYNIQYNYFRDAPGRVIGLGDGTNAAGLGNVQFNLIWGFNEQTSSANFLHGEIAISELASNSWTYNTVVIPSTSMFNTTAFYLLTTNAGGTVAQNTTVDYNVIVPNLGIMGASGITGTFVSGTNPYVNITAMSGTLRPGNVIGCLSSCVSTGGANPPLPHAFSINDFGPPGTGTCGSSNCTGQGGTGTYPVNAGNFSSNNGSFTGAQVVPAPGTSALIGEQAYINYHNLDITGNYVDVTGGLANSSVGYFNSPCISNLGGQFNVTGYQTGTTVTITGISGGGSGQIYLGPESLSMPEGTSAYSGSMIAGTGLTNEVLTGPISPTTGDGPFTSSTCTATSPCTFTGSVSQTWATSGSPGSGASQGAANGINTGAGYGTVTISGNKNLQNGNTVTGFNVVAGNAGCN